MIKYRRIAELPETSMLNSCELLKEVLYNVWLTECFYPEDKNTFVVVLNGEQELADLKNAYPFLNDIEPEIDEVTHCDDRAGFRKIVWITGQDGSGIVALWEVRHGK
jgi:hypothetical protein